MIRITDTVKHLIIINAIIFIGVQLYPDLGYGLLSVWFPENENFKIWQVVTHMFMHGGVRHIAFNMLALWMFGSALEQVWGKTKFLFFYFSAGLGAVLLQLAVNYLQFEMGMSELVAAGYPSENVLELMGRSEIYTALTSDLKMTWEEMFKIFRTPMVGASGAIYGVMVAYAFMFPNSEMMMIFLPIPIKAKYFVPLILVSDVFFGFSGANTGTAHFAHIGGAITGFIMMWYWKKNSFNNKRWN